MSDQKFPYSAWVLMPSFRPKQVEVVEKFYYSDWLGISTGKSYHASNLYESKQQAVGAGLAKLAAQQADIDKRQASLDKRKAELAKHA